MKRRGMSGLLGCAVRSACPAAYDDALYWNACFNQRCKILQVSEWVLSMRIVSSQFVLLQALQCLLVNYCSAMVFRGLLRSCGLSVKSNCCILGHSPLLAISRNSVSSRDYHPMLLKLVVGSFSQAHEIAQPKLKCAKISPQFIMSAKCLGSERQGRILEGSEDVTEVFEPSL